MSFRILSSRVTLFSLLPFFPVCAAVAAGTGRAGAGATAVVDSIVAGEIAVDGVDWTAATEHLSLMDSHDVQLGLQISSLVHISGILLNYNFLASADVYAALRGLAAQLATVKRVPSGFTI